MQEIERSAASVEEAIEAALGELGISEQEADILVIQEPRTGFLRLNPQPAVVRVRSKPQTSDSVFAGGPAAEAQAEAGAAFVEGLAEAMGVEVEVEIGAVDGVNYVDVWGLTEDDDDVALLIGKGGHTLDALQELVRGHVQREMGERCLVVVDVEDYRKRRRSQLVRRVRDIAARVRASGKAESLPAMTAYERKIVHDTVAAEGGLETGSEGDEPDRFVVIRPRTES